MVDKDTLGISEYSTEREMLLGLGRDHTLFAWNAGDAKSDPIGYEDKRLSLCGDSFSMLSFGWVISQLCTADFRSVWLAPGTPGLAATCRPPLSPSGAGAAQATLDRRGSWWHTCPGMSITPGQMFPLLWDLLSGANHASIRASWWDRKILFKTRWRFANHYLEMRLGPAHLLALNAAQLQGHVDSIENPTDSASRQA